jgi:hypothetical protein
MSTCIIPWWSARFTRLPCWPRGVFPYRRTRFATKHKSSCPRRADAAIGSLEIAHLSSWTASAVGAAVALAAAASFAVDSLSAIYVYALAAGPC